ncbi:hypothetical protein ACFE04_028812 [Oxalis oulophora]
MASLSLAVKRAASSSLYSNLLNPIRSASVVRSFNTNAQLTNYDHHHDSDVAVDVIDRRASVRSVFRPSFFSGVPNLMDRIVFKEDKNALYLRMDMPGFGKEHVKVSVEQNTLVIKGEGEKESGDEEVAQARKVSSRIKLLSTNVYQLDEIKAEMKNGVLKVVVPKVKKDQLKNVREINVE